MKKLYFKHANGSMSLVCEIQDEDLFVSKALEDLYRRNPNYQSYYQRVWTDENGWMWIDVGDHLCFYIIKEE